ncbi:hypothetical protein pb186bvf_007427 [Paramecium bursaria]
MIFLIIIANSGVVSQCTCNQLMFEQECSQNTTCEWKNGLCQTFQKQQQPPTIYKYYCDQVPCPQLGCAFYKDKCINFSGCTAYIGENDQDCQLINNQCTSDGTGCIDRQICSAYTTQIDCLKRSSNSGNYKCQWKQKICQDFQCEDAPNTYINDQQCDEFLKGCKSYGLGCTSYLFSCYDYRLDRCLDGILGQEGKCQIIDNLCQPLPCSSAAYTITEQCQQISKKCVSDGFKCLDQLKECNKYQDNCSQVISINGKCIKDKENCRDIQCSDAPSSLQTDLMCNQFLNGCITTGQGCDEQKNECSYYRGSISKCEKYIGISGQCYGSDQNQNCRYKQCEDADITLNSDSQCELFLKGCITNGRGCLSQLKNCDEYFDICDDYIGADGKCTGIGVCQVKQCSQASLKIISNQQCQQYSSQCIYDGQKCVDPQQCMQTTNPIVCSGNSQCLLSGVCIQNNSCSNFKTYSLCLSNQNLRKCYWNNQCLDYTCDMAPSTSDTDQLCADFLNDCVYNGQQANVPKCISINSPCNQFYGIKTTCQLFKAQTACYGSETYGQCKIKLCSDSGLSIRSQNDCNQFWENQCAYNGYNTCIQLNQPCSSYYGTILQPCTNIIAQGQYCANTQTPSGVPKQCKLRICSDAPNTYISNNDCSKWKQGCVARGRVLEFGCQDSSSLCSTYFGTTSECETFNGNGFKCSKYEKFCRAKSCSFVVMNQSHQSCNSYWNNCVYDGQNCILKDLCNSYLLIGTNTLTQSINCQGLLDINGKNCIIGITTCQSAGKCTDYKVDQSKSQQQNIDYCSSIVSNDNECYYVQGSACSYLPCQQISWPKSQADCNLTKELCQYDFNYQCLPFLECTQYITSPYVQDLDTYCNNLKDSNGRFCGYNQGQACVQRTCTITIAAGLTDLQKLTFCNTQGCSFNPSISKFCSQRGLCSAQPSTGSLPIDKMIFCQTVKNQSGIQCSYQGSPYCSDVQACNFYTPSQSSAYNNALTCNKFMGLNNQVCDFITAPFCVSPSTYECISFSSYGTDQQQRFQCQQIAIGNIQCGYNSTKLKNKCSICACDDVPAANVSECSSYMKNACISDGVTCLNRLAQCSQYVASLTNQLTYCLALKTLDGTNCSYQSGLNCSNRLCSDLVSPTSLTDCINFMTGCIFDGLKCVQLKLSCDLYPLQPMFTTRAQRLQQCVLMVDLQNNICGYSPEFPSRCSQKQCEQLISPTKQQDCDNFTTGCFFDGISCITIRDQCNYTALTADKVKYCNSLFDNLKNQCFYSGGITCSYNPCETIPKVDTTNGCLTYSSRCELDTESQCNSLQCSENTSATTDIACSSFQYGCVTNGKGCIPATSDCSVFVGDKTQCEQFSGLNGQQKCSNDGVVANCRNLQCSDSINPLSDDDCQNILPNCVFNGQTCVVEQNCDQFQGNQEQCQAYTALDGPCDGNNYYSSCFIKQCHQAPVSYNTDKECQGFYHGCVTTGNGCILKQSITCDVILNQTTCNQSPQCKWFQYCQERPQNCYLLSTIPSVCANSGINGIKCVYDEKCRPIQCSDLPTYYNKHHLCNQELKNCTSNGNGCVEILNCNQYSDQNSCIYSKPLDAIKCIFDNSKCRPVQCEDLSGETDKKCDNQLQNCLSDGKNCVTSPIKCNQYKIQELCVQDSNQKPCLWVDSQCYSYQRCQDIKRKTHQECQWFSSGCTTDGQQCIPINRCQNIHQQVSCNQGPDGICGWLAQFQKCALFDKCEVAQGSINLQCQQYNTNCISDGVNCIKIDKCMNYLTSTACANQGLDGLCFWEKKFNGSFAGTCKQLECKHIQGNTYEQCQILQTCTTDGQQCINQQNCNQYKLQNQCNFGLDGQCLCQNNQCRQKQCSDVFYKTNRACNIALPNMNCISDGEQCQNSDKCLNYLTKQACTNKGTDGQCAYNNQCQIMTQCSDANNDQDVCKSSKQCYFKINDQHQTQCIQLDCSTNYLINQRCEPVLYYDGKLYQTCSLEDGQCGQKDPKLLNFQECYFQSQKTYRWLNDTCTTQQHKLDIYQLQ